MAPVVMLFRGVLSGMREQFSPRNSVHMPLLGLRLCMARVGALQPRAHRSLRVHGHVRPGPSRDAQAPLPPTHAAQAPAQVAVESTALPSIAMPLSSAMPRGMSSMELHTMCDSFARAQAAGHEVEMGHGDVWGCQIWVVSPWRDSFLAGWKGAGHPQCDMELRLRSLGTGTS